MVELVESGKFLFAPEETQQQVTKFMNEYFRAHPETDTFTLLSTHLPWLKSYFEAAVPNASFLDPTDDVVSKLPLNKVNGIGTLRCLVTESTEHKVSDFKRMLKALKIFVPIELVEIKKS